MLQNENDISSLLLLLVFVALLIIISVIVLFGLFLAKKNKLIKERLQTELKNQKRQHGLELKALRGQMNPHFVHNSLNAIQYYIQQNDVETSENYLARFSKLMRQFFDYSRRQHLSIKEEIELLKNYLEIEKLRFEDKLEYVMKIDSKLDIDEEQIPSMILQPLVENAINHGLFHKQGKGTVIIQFNYISDMSFEVKIIDDGIGIEKARGLEKSIQGKDKTHSSTVLKERLHFLKESSVWNIDFTIQDRSLLGDLSGTEVTLVFKRGVK